MYALMADLHLHPWSAFATTDANGVNNRLAGLLSEIKRAAKDLCDHGGETLVMAGDVFHVRGSVNPIVLNSMIDTLAECNSSYGTQFVIIPGNHDLTGRDSERLGSAVTALDNTFTFVTALSFVAANPRMNIAVVPWHESIDALKAEIEEVKKRVDNPAACDLILHAPIDGVIEGLPAHGLTPEWLGQCGFKRVFAGHYHNHKVFPTSHTAPTEVYSIGALAHHTWSDVGSRAGYLLVKDDEVVWRKSHLPGFVDLSQLAAVDPDDMPQLVDGNYVRVRVDAVKAKEVEQARQELLEMGAKAVLVQAMPKAPARAGVAPITTAAGASLELSVSEFIKSLTFANPAVGMPAVTKAAMDVLASCDALGD